MMKSIDMSRAVYFLVLIVAVVLGFLLANTHAANWVPYVMIGLGALSIGLLLTLLFVKNAGISFSWPALLAMGLVVTLMSTALFKRLFQAPIPDAVQAVVERLEDHRVEQGDYPTNLEAVEPPTIDAALRYVQRQQGDEFTLQYIPEEASTQTYRSEQRSWVVAD